MLPAAVPLPYRCNVFELTWMGQKIAEILPRTSIKLLEIGELNRFILYELQSKRLFVMIIYNINHKISMNKKITSKQLKTFS